MTGLRDLVVAVILVVLVIVMITVFIPWIHISQAEGLKSEYLAEQKKIILREAESASERLLLLRDELGEYEIGDAGFNAIAFSLLAHDRFGFGDQGYYFILDRDFNILFHGDDPGLAGRNLGELITPGGLNLGEVFRRSLAGGESGFVEYDWKIPGRTLYEQKQSYARWIPRLNWYVCTGFYESVTADLIVSIQNSSDNVIDKALKIVLMVFGPIVAFIIALSIWINIRISGISRDLVFRTKNLEQYKKLLDATSMVSRTDSEGNITYVNDKFETVTGYSREEALGKSHNIERHPDTPLETFKDLWTTILSGKIWNGILKNRKADGESYIKEATIIPILDDRGKISEFVSSGRDITYLVNHSRDLEKAFLTDQLTGLGNRQKLMADLDSMDVSAVALFDIQGFAPFNRLRGQNAGDELLRQTGELFMEKLERSAFFFYRLFADTFAVAGKSAFKEDFTEKLVEFISEFGTIEFNSGEDKSSVQLRMGLADRGRESYLYADIALEQARAARELYILDRDEDSGSPVMRHFRKSVSQISHALKNDGVFPIYQPILNLHTGKIGKFECLARIRGESGEILYPGSFIEVSKKVQMYQQITLKMLQHAVDYFRDLPYEFSVNLGVEDLTNRETVDFLIDLASQPGIAERIIIEIVETRELEDLEKANRILRSLRDMGIKIAIDDFGSGYSSFNYLLNLNPRYVKIDGSITQHIVDDGRARELVKSLVDFARGAEMETVAEYVDSQEIFDLIKELGVDYAQGWFIGKGSTTALTVPAFEPDSGE